MAISPKKPSAPATPTPQAAAPRLVVVPAVETGKVFETAAAPAREMQENLRKAAEHGLEQGKAVYAKARTAAEEATQSLEASYVAAVQGVTALNAKAVDAMRANVDAGFGFFKALAGVKSLPEAFEVQSGHARKQFDALTFQVKEMATMAQTLAAEAVAPIKAGVSKALARAG